MGYRVIIFITILFRSAKENVMAINYNPLWYLLIEKGMKKELREHTGIPINTMVKFGVACMQNKRDKREI